MESEQNRGLEISEQLVHLPDDGVGERLEAGDAAFGCVALLYDHRPRRPRRDHVSR